MPGGEHKTHATPLRKAGDRTPPHAKRKPPGTKHRTGRHAVRRPVYSSRRAPSEITTSYTAGSWP